MDPSFKKRLHTLASQAEAYIEQIKNEDPLASNLSIFSCHHFETKQEEPPKTSADPLPKPPTSTELKKTYQAPTFSTKQQAIETPKKNLETPVMQSKPKPLQNPVFALHKPVITHKLPDEDLHKAFTKIAPHILANRPIPSDEKAKLIKNGWKEKNVIPVVPILASDDKSLVFLQNVAQAITLHFFPAKVLLLKDLEKQNLLLSLLDSAHVKLIISPDITLWNCKELMKHYQEIPQQKQRFLKNTPLLLLPDPSLYIKDPSLKRSLWNLLCHLLQPLQT